MSRRRRKAALRKILRLINYIIIISIFAFGYSFYRGWYENYRQSHPHVIEAVSTDYYEEQPLEGLLLWDEPRRLVLEW